MALLEVRDLAVTFGVGDSLTRAVDGISFAINMDAHNFFELGPATRHLENILTAEQLAA